MSMVNRVDKTEQQEQKRNFDRKKKKIARFQVVD